jgi:hypothetical protein
MKRKNKPQSTMLRFFPSLAGKQQLSLETHMFSEDIRNGVLPIGGTSHAKHDFKIRIEGEAEHCNKVLALCDSIVEYRSSNITDRVCRFFQEIINSLSWRGRVLFEIVRDNEDFLLHEFTDKRLFHIPPYYIQLIPISDRRILGVSNFFATINKANVWTLSMPPALGGFKGYRQILKKLQKYNHVVPEFIQSNYESYFKGQTTFNFNEYVHIKEIYTYRATKRWGWNRRKYDLQDKTEFYLVYQHLTQQLAMCILREHVAEEFNELIKRIGWECKVIVEGLPTSSEVLDIRSKLLNGETTFTDALERVKIQSF